MFLFTKTKIALSIYFLDASNHAFQFDQQDFAQILFDLEYLHDFFCVQINEFGQAPRQLFSSPHPPRLLKRKSTIVDSDTLSNYSAKSEGFRGLSMEFVSRIMNLASPPQEIPAIEATLVPSVSVKFQISLDTDLTTEALPETLGRAPRKMRAGTPMPIRAQSMSSDSELEDDPLGKSHNDELPGSSEREIEGAYDWHSGSAVSSSGLDFSESIDPFDVVKDVDMVLPSKLRKSHLRNISETSAVQPSDNLESNNLERHDLQAGVTPQEENDEKSMAWHSMFRQRLSEPQCLKLHRSPVNACILSEDNAAGFVTMYSVDKDGFIKVGFSHTFSPPYASPFL